MKCPPVKWSPVVVVQRADDGKLVGDFGLAREQLADLDARHVGADGVPEAAIFGRSLGLEVVQVHVAGPAVEPQHDDRGVFLGPAQSLGNFLGPQDLRQPDGGHAGEPELDEAAAGHAVAIRPALPCVNPEHDVTPRGSRNFGVDASKRLDSIVI